MTRALHHRLRDLGTRVRESEPVLPEEAATVRWLKFLKALLPVLEREAPSAEVAAAIANTREQIEVLERGPDLNSYTGAHVEYFCNACLLRLHWHTKDWEGKRLAVADEEWQRHFRRVAVATLTGTECRTLG